MNQTINKSYSHDVIKDNINFTEEIKTSMELLAQAKIHMKTNKYN